MQLPNDVLLFTPKRVGDAGRRGDTVVTPACDRFQCNANARRLPPLAYTGSTARPREAPASARCAPTSRRSSATEPELPLSRETHRSRRDRTKTHAVSSRTRGLAGGRARRYRGIHSREWNEPAYG
ncbi:FBP domain-containing protein [Microbacterium lacticum]